MVDMPAKGNKVIAELSITPIGEGTSVSRYVKIALDELRKNKKLRIEVNPMGTVIEADTLREILDAVMTAHESLFNSGLKRVDFILKVDDRRDKPRSMDEKVKAVL